LGWNELREHHRERVTRVRRFHLIDVRQQRTNQWAVNQVSVTPPAVSHWSRSDLDAVGSTLSLWHAWAILAPAAGMHPHIRCGFAERRQRGGTPRTAQLPYWAREVRALQLCTGVVFDLRRLDTGSLVHQYATEGAALAFIRDVVRIPGREQAACFVLDERDVQGNTQAVAEGADLVRRALQDRAK
jgi:hypothetical protein